MSVLARIELRDVNDRQHGRDIVVRRDGVLLVTLVSQGKALFGEATLDFTDLEADLPIHRLEGAPFCRDDGNRPILRLYFMTGEMREYTLGTDATAPDGGAVYARLRKLEQVKFHTQITRDYDHRLRG